MTSDNYDPDDLCPVCGSNPFDGSEFCEHLVTCLCHDSDCALYQAQIYFGNGQMGCEFDDLFQATLRLAIDWLKAEQEHRNELQRRIAALPSDLKAFASHVIDQLAVWENSPAFTQKIEETIDEDILIDEGILDLQKLLEELFHQCWKEQANAIKALDWEISHSPGLAWSGKNYWATDGEACANGIRRMVDDYTMAIQRIPSSSAN